MAPKHRSLVDRLEDGEPWIDLLKEAVALYPTQTDAANALGLTQPNISQWLNEHRTPHPDRQEVVLMRLVARAPG